jgi:alkylhydroperoxidase family enzyme
MQQGITEEMYAHLDESRDSDLYSEREKLAIEYTERFVLDHLSLDDAFFARLADHFDPGELVELTYCIARHMALGRVTQVLELDLVCPVDPTAGDGN